MSSSSGSPSKPSLLVFDLDYTIWPFWVDTHFSPPFRKENGHVFDADDKQVEHYPNIPEIFANLTNDGYKIGIASRTPEIDGAESLLELYNLNQYISYKEIYPGSKVNHFERIKQASGLDYSAMIFFDDEDRNIKDVQQIGVTSILVESGLSAETIEGGLREFANNNK